MGLFIPLDELPMETDNGIDLESSMVLLPATESFVSNDGYNYVMDNIDGDGLGEGNGYSTRLQAASVTGLDYRSDGHVYPEVMEGIRFVVSVSVMEVILKGKDDVSGDKSSIDSGAIVVIVPVNFVAQYGLFKIPHKDGRRIGTADQDGTLEILYWVDSGGYIGPAAVSSQVTFIIVAVSRLQAGGMSVDFPANEQICVLHTRRGVGRLL
jgi:hypothetical protein